jgi:site-specific DNA-methyltransferase (adenine-specific)
MKPYYEKDGIVIYNCDCREVLPFVGQFDLCLTDPPYGIDIASQPFNYQRAKGKEKEDWDESRPRADIFTTLRTICKDQVFWGGNYFADLLPASRGWLCWRKPDRLPSMADYELAWTSRDMNSRMIEVTAADTNKERVGHFCQKPLKVMTFSLSFFPDARTIIDPFMGSGTTLVAAKQLCRKAVGIEINEKYCEIAALRLSQEVMDFGEVA